MSCKYGTFESMMKIILKSANIVIKVIIIVQDVKIVRFVINVKKNHFYIITNQKIKKNVDLNVQMDITMKLKNKFVINAMNLVKHVLDH